MQHHKNEGEPQCDSPSMIYMLRTGWSPLQPCFYFVILAIPVTLPLTSLHPTCLTDADVRQRSALHDACH
jgi:hypothetical protein